MQTSCNADALSSSPYASERGQISVLAGVYISIVGDAKKSKQPKQPDQSLEVECMAVEAGFMSRCLGL